MKKILVLLSVSVLALGMSGCRGEDDNPGSQSSVQQSSEGNQSAEGTEELQTSESNEEQETGTVVNGHDYADGWTEEMETVKAAVTDALGENYWPDTAVTPDLLEVLFGISPEMYDDYLAETPMISANVDTLLIVRAKEDQVQAVEEALNAYRDSKVNDTMQYPMNVGKIQASRVERIGNYVCFVQLGADTTEAAENGDDAVIAQCQETNELVIEIISQKVQH